MVERDRAIASFVPQPFWTVDAHLEQGGIRFQTRWQPTAAVSDAVGRCVDETAAQQTLRRLTQAGSAQIDSVEVERVREGPPLPFDLGTLQEICSAKLGLGAQALYETHKATTYPRTDCG